MPPKPIPKYSKIFLIIGCFKSTGLKPNKKKGLFGVNTGLSPIENVIKNLTVI